MTHSELCRHWYNGWTDSKRAGNMLIAGRTIYSYGLHFPIASKHRGKILFTLRDYSVTTAKHKSNVCRVIPYYELVNNTVYTFDIESIEQGLFVKRDLEYFVDGINEHADKSKRAWRHGTWEVEMWFKQIEQLYRAQSHMADLGIYFDIPKFSPPSLRYCNPKLFGPGLLDDIIHNPDRFEGVPEDFLNECKKLYVKDML